MAPQNDLSNLDIDEVSPVRRGAIGKLWAFFKADDEGDLELRKETVDALAAPFDGEKELVEKLRGEGLDESEIEVSVAIARLEKAKKSMAAIDAQENVNDAGADDASDADGDDAATQATLAKNSDAYTATLDAKKRKKKVSGDPDPSDDLDDAAQSGAKPNTPLVKSADDLGGSSNATKEHVMGDSPTGAPVVKEDGSWDVSGVEDPATRSFYENVLKSLDDAKAEGESLRESVKKAEERASDLEGKLVEKEIVAKAEGEFSKIAKADELVPVLKAAKESLPAEQYEALETLLKSANARIAEGDLFAELGRTMDPVLKAAMSRGEHRVSADGDAWDQIVEKANAMVIKGDEDLNEEQRVTKYLETKEGQADYADYMASRHGAVA